MSYGRRKIFKDATEITAANVIEEVNAAYLVHSDNRNEISMYLYYHNKTVIQSVHHHCKSIKARHFCPAFFSPHQATYHSPISACSSFPLCHSFRSGWF